MPFLQSLNCRSSKRRSAVLAMLLTATLGGAGAARADLPTQIEKIKPSVVVVGYFKATNSPRFGMSGTGFAVGDGSLVVTNAHVLVDPSVADTGASLVVQVRTGRSELQARAASVLEIDRAHDLALLRIEGAPLPALTLQAGDGVREGQSVAFMGFPIGGVLGFSPVTHRGIVSSITAAALPSPTAQQLSNRSLRSLREGSFDLYQLDATAYPVNSGGPLFDPDTGEVLGVLNMVLLKSTRESALSQPTGICYAIPSGFIVKLMQRLKGP